MRRFTPWALAIAFALWSYRPSADSIVGWGGDPLFNVWTFEVVWHNLGTGTPLFSAPLFGGSPLGLAFSENQVAPALLLWPVRALTGNGALTLAIGAVISSLLTVACAAGWLRSLGARSLAEWGGLVLAACGWLQSQCAHYQNLYIFLLPLALWSWSAYARDPRPLRLCLCALAFGWIAGWNLYFQVFADLCLIVLAVRARRPLVLALALALQVPFLLPYAAAGDVVGGYATSVTYGAGLRSLLGSSNRPRLLLPSFDVNIESAGYLGPVWLILMALSLQRPQARGWLIAAAIAFWAALGQGYGLFDLLRILPGVSALRATGRAQILVVVFSLPAVFGWLETLPLRTALAGLLLVTLDLLPAAPPDRTPIDPRLWGPPTALSRELSRSADPLLVLPAADERFMIDATQSWTPYFGGFSGRAPPGEALVNRLAAAGRFAEALELARPTRALALTPDAARGLGALPGLRLRGCFRHLDLGEPCLFDASVQAPELRLDRDTAWERPAAGPPGADLRATRTGVLEAKSLDRCQLRRIVRIVGIPLASRLPLHVPAARYSAGDLVLHVGAPQWLFRIRAVTPEFEISCDSIASE